MYFGEGEAPLTRDMRKDNKAIQVEVSQCDRACQTKLTLVSSAFDDLLESNEAIEDLVNELKFRKKLITQIENQHIEDKDLENEELIFDKLSRIVQEVNVAEEGSSGDLQEIRLDLGKTRSNNHAVDQATDTLLKPRKSDSISRPLISIFPDNDCKFLNEPGKNPLLSPQGSILIDNFSIPEPKTDDRGSNLMPSLLSIDKLSITKSDLPNQDPQPSITPFQIKENIPTPLAFPDFASCRHQLGNTDQGDGHNSLSPTKSAPKFTIVLNQTEPIESSQGGILKSKIFAQQTELEPIDEEAEKAMDGSPLSQNSLERSKTSQDNGKEEGLQIPTGQKRQDYRKYMAKSSDINMPSIKVEEPFIPEKLRQIEMSFSQQTNLQSNCHNTNSSDIGNEAGFAPTTYQQPEPETLTQAEGMGSPSRMSNVNMFQRLTFEMNKSVLLTKRLQKEKQVNLSLASNQEASTKKIKDLLKSLQEKADKIKELEEELTKVKEERISQDIDSEQSKREDEEGDTKRKKREERKERARKYKEDKMLINQQLMNYTNLEGKLSQHNAKNLISKLNMGKFQNFKNPMSLKTVMRTIYTLYIDRMEEVLNKPETKNLPFCEYVYNYYLQVFGIKNISEKKFTYFILSLKCHIQYFRVNLFSRFIGLIEHQKYDEDLIAIYFEGMRSLETSTKGYPIKNKDSSVRFYYPYIRAIDFLNQLFADKIPRHDLLEFRKSLDKLKEPDPNSLNSAIIDLDMFMDKVIEKYSVIVTGNKQYVIDAFKACDLDGNNTCSVNEFLLLNRYLEPGQFELSTCIKRFFDNADTIIGKEQNMSFNKFAVVSTNFNLFSEKSQNDFLGVADRTDLETQFKRLQKDWKEKFPALSRKLDKFDSLTPEETKNWRTILEVLNTRIAVETIVEIRPTLIALKMTELEFDRIAEEDELADDEEHSDLTKLISKRTIQTGFLKESIPGKLVTKTILD